MPDLLTALRDCVELRGDENRAGGAMLRLGISECDPNTPAYKKAARALTYAKLKTDAALRSLDLPALLAAVENDRWIPVAERLPEQLVNVLVFGGIAYWRDPCPAWPDGQWFTITGERWPGKPILWQVTHWKPLPAAPQSEEGKA